MPEFEPEKIPEETRGAIERAGINIEEANKAVAEATEQTERDIAAQDLERSQQETEKVSTIVIEQSGIAEQGSDVVSKINDIQKTLVTGTVAEFSIKVSISLEPGVKNLNEVMNNISKNIGEYAKNFGIDIEKGKNIEGIKDIRDIINKYISDPTLLDNDLTREEFKNFLKNLDEKLGKIMEENGKVIQQSAEKSGIIDKIKEKFGSTAWEMLKLLMAIGSLVGIGIGIAALIAKALTGCYQYIKPNPGQKLSAGCSNLFDKDDEQKFCSCIMESGTSDGTSSCQKNNKYVYCNPSPCANNPQYCTKTRSEDNAVWYAYAEYSIWDVFSNIMNFVVQKITTILDGATDFLSTILKYGKWALIIIGIIFLLGLVFSVLKRIWPSSNNSEKIVYIQNPMISQTSNIPVKTSFKFY
jgi:hypothetical protein